MENIAIVREYMDVFSKTLPSLSPDREIEFSIKLLSGTCPVSKALIEWSQQK